MKLLRVIAWPFVAVIIAIALAVLYLADAIIESIHPSDGW